MLDKERVLKRIEYIWDMLPADKKYESYALGLVNELYEQIEKGFYDIKEKENSIKYHNFIYDKKNEPFATSVILNFKLLTKEIKDLTEILANHNKRIRDIEDLKDQFSDLSIKIEDLKEEIKVLKYADKIHFKFIDEIYIKQLGIKND